MGDGQVTQLLESAAAGDARSAEALLPLIYDELRRLAAAQLRYEPGGMTLQPTALVHEAYLKLLGGTDVKWHGKRHFFAAAANAMRRILVDRARYYRCEKHGGGRGRAAMDSDAMTIADPTPIPGEEPIDLLKLNSALERLENSDPRQAEVVMLRYFAGLGVEQTAEALGISQATVKNDWVYARAWLRRELVTLTSENE